MSKFVKNLPKAATLINSMRSIGYEFETAVADIIDNSISAKAKNIDILFSYVSSDEVYVQVIDDGFGMNDAELFEAMRFGSTKEERLDTDLGRFGLGLKTASISQCRRLTVVSKKDNIINSYVWDLDIIEEKQDWNLIKLSSDKILQIPNIKKYLNLKSFTVVYWEKFDILERQTTNFNTANDVLLKKLDKTKEHLSLVFHRFIEKGLNIKIGSAKVEGFDPFLKNHQKTTISKAKLINVKSSSQKDVKVEIQTFVLPYHKDLDKKDYELLGGISESKHQGFYIYRNERLMVYGTWFNARPKFELSKNARIRVDIPNSLDDLWSIDIKKQKAIIPPNLLDQLKGEITKTTEKSEKIYSYKGSIQIKKDAIWQKIIDDRDKTINYKINKDVDLIKTLFNNLDDNNRRIVNNILTLIELSIPFNDIYSSVAKKIDINPINEDNKEALLNSAIELFYNYKRTKNLSNDEIINFICSFEPYFSANIKSELEEKLND